MKTFNEAQMSDPWLWCRDMLDKHNISARILSDLTAAPRSTVRALYNGGNASPRYSLLCDIITLCIALENGERPYATVKTVTKVATSQPIEEYDFL